MPKTWGKRDSNGGLTFPTGKCPSPFHLEVAPEGGGSCPGGHEPCRGQGMSPLWVPPQPGMTPLSLPVQGGACGVLVRQGECLYFWKSCATPPCSQRTGCFLWGRSRGTPMAADTCPPSRQNLLCTKQPTQAATHLPNPFLKKH